MRLYRGILSILETSGQDPSQFDRPLIISALVHSKYLTLSQIRQWTKSIASGLRRQGLQPGDRVLVLSNMEESFIFDVVIFLAVVAARGIYCGMDMGNGPAEIVKAIRSAEPQVILANPSQWSSKVTVSTERTGFPLSNVFVINDPFDLSSLASEEPSVPGARWWNDLFDHESGTDFRFPSVDENDTVSLTWTSGTSGNKKAVQLTHRNYIASWAVFAQEYSQWENRAKKYPERGNSQMRILSMYNIAHVSGSRLLRLLAVACKGHDIQYYQLAKGAASRAPQLVIELASKHQATHIWAPAGVCYRLSELSARTDPLTRHTRYVDLSSLASVTVVGAPCPRSVFKSAHKFLGLLGANLRELRINNNWGMTECAGSIVSAEGCATTLPDYHVGVVYPGMQIRVNNSGVSSDRSGEIEVKGPCVTKGYWRDPVATKEAFTEDGWFRTGDVGMLVPSEEDVNVFALQILGRSKEMLKDIDGRQICLPQIESTLMEHPRVSQAAVVAVPAAGNHAGFEKPMAFLTGDITIVEAVRHIAREMSANCHLEGRVHILPVLPTTPDHKIDKVTLRQSAIRMMT